MVEVDFQMTHADFCAVRDAVYEHCGISLSDDKMALVRARLTRQVRAGGFVSVSEYLEHALSDRNSDGFTELIDAISTNLTSFFREGEHFQYLSETALPLMLKEKRKQGEGRIVAWSAACSSGEEAYSIAIIILEAIEKLGRDSLKWDVRLLATDISTRMLSAAAAGVYHQSRLAGVPANYRAKYFSEVESDVEGESGEYVVSPALRSMVRTRHLNLMGAWPFKGPFDFIFCRNVMIYFDQETQQGLIERFWNCLKPGGLLFTGHSESLTGISHRFMHRRASIYEKSKS